MKKEWIKKTIAAAFVTVLMLIVLVGVGKAQTEAGQIVGKVSDPNGALVSGASVSVKSVDTGRAITTTSMLRAFTPSPRCNLVSMTSRSRAATLNRVPSGCR
jgi:hypothetical protein